MNSVHLSIDDIYMSLRSEENNILSVLKQMHTAFGAKFTLYHYTDMEGWQIEQIPKPIGAFLKDNRDWLKLGFHSANETPFSSSERDYNQCFLRSRCIWGKLKAATTDILRLHYWDATDEQKDFLRKKGVQVLLMRDDDDLPYDEFDKYEECGITMRRTRVRFENITDISLDSLHIGKPFIAAFTHEWCFAENEGKIWRALEIYSGNGYTFI